MRDCTAGSQCGVTWWVKGVQLGLKLICPLERTDKHELGNGLAVPTLSGASTPHDRTFYHALMSCVCLCVGVSPGE